MGNASIVSPQTMQEWRELIATMGKNGNALDVGAMVEQFVSSIYNKRAESLSKYGYIHRGLLAWQKAMAREKERAEKSLEEAQARGSTTSLSPGFAGVQLSMRTAQEIAASVAKRGSHGNSGSHGDGVEVKREPLAAPLTQQNELVQYIAALADKMAKVDLDITNVTKYLADAAAYQQARANDLRAMSMELYEAAQGVLTDLSHGHGS